MTMMICCYFSVKENIEVGEFPLNASNLHLATVSLKCLQHSFYTQPNFYTQPKFIHRNSYCLSFYFSFSTCHAKALSHHRIASFCVIAMPATLAKAQSQKSRDWNCVSANLLSFGLLFYFSLSLFFYLFYCTRDLQVGVEDEELPVPAPSFCFNNFQKTFV